MARQPRLPASIARLKERYPAKVDEVSVERDEFDGPRNPYSYWLYLKPGWWNPRHEVHCIHEVSVKDFMEVWRAVEPCDCEQCREELDQAS